MSQQGGRPTGHEDDWWGQLYDSTDDTGPTPAPDSLDDRFASAAGAVSRDGSGGAGRTAEEPAAPADDGSGRTGPGGTRPGFDAAAAGERGRRSGPGTGVPAPRSGFPDAPEDPPRTTPHGPPAPPPPRSSPPRTPWDSPPDASEGPVAYPPGPKPPGFVERTPEDRQAPPSGSRASTETPPATSVPSSRMRSDVPPPPHSAPPPPAGPPGATPRDSVDPGARRPEDDWWATAPAAPETAPTRNPPPTASRTGPGSTQPNPTAEPPGSHHPAPPPTPQNGPSSPGQAAPTTPAPGQRGDGGSRQAGPVGPASGGQWEDDLRQADPAAPAPGQRGDGGSRQAGPVGPASGRQREDDPRQAAPTTPAPGQRGDGGPPRTGPAAGGSPQDHDGVEAGRETDPDLTPRSAPAPQALRTATHVDLPTLPPVPVAFVGSGPPTYDAEPTALPPADPDELDDLVADTVLDGARYGTCTLRAVSVRGDSARFRGEPRRDSLLTARFGTGDQALILVAMATGARATPGAHRAAAEACHWIGRAVGRSHARLAQDIGAARRGDLKSGLHRLTDRSLGKLRASAAEQGVDPEEYAATLRCLLLPADPDCRVRVFFGVGEGGLFRLRDGAWHDIEPRITDITGEPVVGFGSLPSETPEGDRLTMDLGIPTPPSPYEPAPEPSRQPFRFRASVARPGDTLLMCTGGLAEPLRGEPDLCEYLTGRWSGPPPGLAGFLADSQVRVKGYADDRTAAAVWEA
ncbi:protein phosphatase 2C domain-containing protein [Streptomyces sp. NPDC048420]|uniref:protein phosphatase 2C domain-containing protein n=1 Tax=Streptomyces sp. NPDC048420 TaxID=3155755 RepID=UPI003428C9C1